MLIIKFAKMGNFIIWLKVIESYSYSVISNGYSFLYNLCLFVLFFPYKLYRFSIRLIVVFIFWNWYVCLIFSKVLWIFRCSCNGCLYIFRISCFYSFISIYNLLLFFFAVYYVFVFVSKDRYYCLFVLLCWQSFFIGNNFFSFV